MGSRAFLLLGLLVVVALLISSEVAARDLAETYGQKNAEDTKEANEVDNAKYGGGYPGGGYGGYPGGGYGGYPGGGYGGYPGGGYGGYPGGGGGYGSRGGYGGRGRCYYGCCRRDYDGRGCRRCCSYTGEAPDVVTEDKPQN